MTSGGVDGSIDSRLIFSGVAGSFLIAGAIGVGGAFLWSALLDRVRQFPNTVFTTFAYVFILYSIAELQGYSGAIAALAFGIAIANFPNIPSRLLGKLFTFRLLGFAEHERAFFAEVVFLVKTFFFVFLGLSISLSNLRAVAVGLLLIPAIVAFRLVVVRLIGDKQSTRREAMLTTALVPKGLASAVLAALPAQMGLAGGEVIQSTVYAVILFSIVGSAAAVFMIERGTLAPFSARFFKPFAETAPEPDRAPERALPRITTQSLGLPAIPDDLIDPNVVDLEAERPRAEPDQARPGEMDGPDGGDDAGDLEPDKGHESS
jgi:NhaP-type Na+/H+ or K+/H+ antiporter